MFFRLHKGDDLAWAEFCELYSRPSLSFLQSRLGLDRDDALDLFQETTLKVWQLLKSGWQYNPKRGRFRDFLMTTLRHQFQDLRKKQIAKKRGAGNVVSLDAPIAGYDSEAAAGLERLEDERMQHITKSRAAIDEALRALLRDAFTSEEVEAYRDVFWRDDGETDDKIAHRHGISRRHLRYLRQRIRAHFARLAAVDGFTV